MTDTIYQAIVEREKVVKDAICKNRARTFGISNPLDHIFENDLNGCRDMPCFQGCVIYQEI